MFNKKFNIPEWVIHTEEFNWYKTPIKISNNVMIGAKQLFYPIYQLLISGNWSRINSDKNIPSISVGAGVPCKKVGDISELIS